MERKYKALVSKLAELSFSDKNEPRLDTATQIIKFLKTHWPKSAKKLLEYYYVCLRRSYELRCLHIEHACLPPNIAFASSFSSKKHKLIYHENQQLIGGMRVRHGDWVWDYSIKGQLNKLMQTFKNI